MAKGYIWGIIAVLCWSTSATVAGTLDGKATFFQIVLLMQITAAATLLVVSLPELHKFLINLLKGLISFKHGIRFLFSLLIFSGFITIYHLSFYYALHHAPRIEANIINYLWPLLLFLTGSTIFKVNRDKIGLYDLALVLLAFIGAFTIAWDPSVPPENFVLTTGLAVAFVAAFSAPVYMNMSVLLRREFFDRPQFVYLAGFLISIPSLLLASNIFSQDIIPRPEAVPYILYLGVATIALAHVAWTKAIDLGPAVTVSNLAYLVPVLSTALLIVLLGDSPSNKILFGASLIVFSNVLSNEAFRRVHAESGAVIAFFYVSFSIYFKEELGMEKMVFASLDYLGQVFAIISGFFLARMWQKNREEQSTLVKFSTELDALVKDLTESGFEFESTELGIAIDQLMLDVADFDVCANDAERALYAEKLKTSFDKFLRLVESDGKAARGGEVNLRFVPVTLNLRGLLNNWIVQKFDRASVGEITILALLGFAGAVLVVGTSKANLVLDLVAMTFASSIAYIVLKIRDYNNMAAISDYSRLLIVQAVLRRIGKPYYIGDYTLLYNKFRPEELGWPIRFRDQKGATVSSTGRLPGQAIGEYRSSRNFLLVLLGAGLITVIMLLADKYYDLFGALG